MSLATPPSDFAPKHVRAARALLAWSQQDLAKKADVATSTVADFERGQRKPVANNAQAMREALEGAGIQFLPTGAVVGPPVPRMSLPGMGGAPIRWVSTEDLGDWTNRTDGVENLPTLLAHLIFATHGAGARLRFPAGESIRFSGWDGRSDADQASAYVPLGKAVWELGSQRSKIAQKAKEDYEKRTSAPGDVVPADTVYIFVTPRRWPQKDQWAADRKAEGIWRDVQVWDGDDLVHWIEQTPAVGLWLATRLGKRPDGTRGLAEVWEEWSLATERPLTGDLVLSDRDEDATQVLKWLREDPSVLSIRATTSDEAVAFFHAAIGTLPDELAAHYEARCLVAADATAARALMHAPAPQIIVMTEPEAGLAQTLADRGHYVLQAYDDRPVGRGEVRTLTRPSREGIASALIDAGYPEARARGLARDSARNLAILRRLIPTAPGRQPTWAQNPPRALLGAMLAGGWDENSEADKQKVSELADMPYDQVEAALAPYVGQFDSPLRKVGSTWRVASPPDAWVPLAPYLTAADLKRFGKAALAVLGAPDPRFDMASGDRWMAAVKGVLPEYSGMLRHGVGQVLILLAVWGQEVKLVADAGHRADSVVATLLRKADERRWWSLSRDFRLLAEASPTAFLDAIEDSLDQNDPPIRALFGHDEGGVFGAEHLSDLLWALESLAWSPALLNRVSYALARLDVIDNPPGKFGNRPANSLREVHLLWSPQTNATLDQRLKALDLLRKREPAPAWKLMMGILPAGHDTSSPSPTPLWRDYSVDEVEAVTWPLIGRGAAEVSKRLLDDVGLDIPRWQLLIGRMADMVPDREAVLAALDSAEPKITNPSDRSALWTTLRQQLHHHRQFPDADWSLPAAELDRLEDIYDRVAPTDPLDRVAWLFGQSHQLPNPPPGDWQAEEKLVDQARQQAALAISKDLGGEGVLRLARLIQGGAGYLGKALYDGGAPDLEDVVKVAIQSDHDPDRDVAHGLIVSMFNAGKEPWADALIARARDEEWGDRALLIILRAMPQKPWTWDHAAAAGADLETEFWKSVPIWWIDDGAEAEIAIRKLISVGRGGQALHLAGRERQIKLPTDLLVQVLREALHSPPTEASHSNDRVMFGHYVVEILTQLDGRDDVDVNEMASLEWNYLPVLTHSRRPAKVLLKGLSQQPPLFIDLLRAVFRPSEESGYVDPEPENPEHARAVANQAYRLLDQWDRLPGQADDGTIDGEAMEAWIKQARELARAIGRDEIADNRIGKILSASPLGADGAWPAERVRDVLDLYRNQVMLEGFQIGKSNRRGVTTRMPRDGGKQERALVEQYRRWSAVVGAEHPYTAKALDALAAHYEVDAQREDERAERIDWET
ncbi:MAG TPA: helix-turn-helix transcriptional regulator [Caulobacteraceae bacterium]